MDNQTVHLVRTVKELRAIVKGWHAEGLKVGLVPTMGALHHGHLSLIDEVAEKAERVIVSIFVNPKQFGAHEDFGNYPRQEAEDLEKLKPTPANLVFAPTPDEMYPEGHQTSVIVHKTSVDYEGKNRPGHFEGVATVVTKLFMQSQCDVAIFGEKDYQQLAVIRQFVRDLDIPVEVMGGTLVREPDGLASSSRNVYLNPEERKSAGQFNVILKELVKEARSGKPLRDCEAHASEKMLKAGFTEVDYVSIVDPLTLIPLDTLPEMPARVLSVGRFGKVRLLDNMPV